MRARGAGNALRSGRRRRITHGGQCIEFSQSEQLLLQSHVLLRQPLALPPQERAVFLHVLQLRPVWCHIIRYTLQTIYIYIHISDKLFSVYWWSSRLASRCTRRKGVIACFGEHRIENRVITWLVEWSIYIYIYSHAHIPGPSVLEPNFYLPRTEIQLLRYIKLYALINDSEKCAYMSKWGEKGSKKWEGDQQSTHTKSIGSKLERILERQSVKSFQI